MPLHALWILYPCTFPGKAASSHWGLLRDDKPLSLARQLTGQLTKVNVCRMGWTQYLELSSLERSIDWDSQCSSRRRGKQLLLPAIFINITCGPPVAADHNSYAKEPTAQPTLKESSTDRPDNQVLNL